MPSRRSRCPYPMAGSDRLRMASRRDKLAILKQAAQAGGRLGTMTGLVAVARCSHVIFPSHCVM